MGIMIGSKSVPRRKYILKNGPFDGSQVWLSGPPTLVFSINGKKGRYCQHQDPMRSKGILVWSEI